jgi:hypothetical protein
MLFIRTLAQHAPPNFRMQYREDNLADGEKVIASHLHYALEDDHATRDRATLHGCESFVDLIKFNSCTY